MVVTGKGDENKCKMVDFLCTGKQAQQGHNLYQYQRQQNHANVGTARKLAIDRYTKLARSIVCHGRPSPCHPLQHATQHCRSLLGPHSRPLWLHLL